MPADDHVLLDAGERPPPPAPPARSGSGSPRRSAASRGRRGPGRARRRRPICVSGSAASQARWPRSSCAADQRVRSTQRPLPARAVRGDLPVAVPAQEERPLAERRAAGRATARGIGPMRDVAADDDRVHLERLDLRQHRLERRQVSVDVVERRDPHPGFAGGRRAHLPPDQVAVGDDEGRPRGAAAPAAR